MAYYYLMAQLPYLFYDHEPPMSSQEFKTLAKSLMPKCDAVLLDSLCLDPSLLNDASVKNGFIKAWRDWERTMRLNLAKQRAIKFKRDMIEPPTSYMDASAAATKAIDESSPLKAEIILDKARWNAIDDLAGNNYFHRNTAFAYYLKLLLIERRKLFNVDNGFAEYKSLYASIVDSVHNAGDSK